jgi:hypothetical protein
MTEEAKSVRANAHCGLLDVFQVTDCDDRGGIFINPVMEEKWN